MKAFVGYDERGRITSVSIANPEFAGDVVVEASEAGSVLAVEVGDVMKGAEQVTFATARGEDAKRLQEVVSRIAEQYRVDPTTRRLLPSDQPR